MAAVELDRILRKTRIELEQKHGTKDLDYYCSPLKELWQRDWPALADSVTAGNVKQAVAEIDRDGIPSDARSSTYDLVEGGKRYPPKLVLSLALKYATGVPLPRHEFAGGDDTVGFRILRELGFSIVPKQFIGEMVERFLSQANAGQDLRTSSYPKEYRGLQIKFGLGQGGFSRMPWIAFLAAGEKVSEGISPVLLYYREAHLLIFAFGVSETNRPSRNWSGLGQSQKVSEYLREKYSRDPERYGDSCVDTAFEIPDGLDIDRLTLRLDAMIELYENSLAHSPTTAMHTEVRPEIEFTEDEAVKDVFVDEEHFLRLLNRLGNKKNIILQGPPGVGKTFFCEAAGPCICCNN